MRLSVIIPALNEAENILSTIESVRQQDRAVEIIVVDGGSVDGTPEIARTHVTVISSPRGRATQMNAGLWLLGVKPHTLAKWYAARKARRVKA